MTESGRLWHHHRKLGLIYINGSLANGRAIMAATGLTPTHCHCHSTVLITSCLGLFNWTYPIRARERSGLLSSAVVVTQADGRKIKNVAAESHFAYPTFSNTFICTGTDELWEIARQPHAPLMCLAESKQSQEDMLCKCCVSKCNGVKWCVYKVSCWIFLFNYVLMNCDNVELRGEMSMKYLLEI